MPNCARLRPQKGHTELYRGASTRSTCCRRQADVALPHEQWAGEGLRRDPESGEDRPDSATAEFRLQPQPEGDTARRFGAERSQRFRPRAAAVRAGISHSTWISSSSSTGPPTTACYLRIFELVSFLSIFFVDVGGRCAAPSANALGQSCSRRGGQVLAAASRAANRMCRRKSRRRSWQNVHETASRVLLGEVTPAERRLLAAVMITRLKEDGFCRAAAPPACSARNSRAASGDRRRHALHVCDHCARGHPSEVSWNPPKISSRGMAIARDAVTRRAPNRVIAVSAAAHRDRA